MGKKSKKSKVVEATPETLSKKERKALEAREAEIAAELERRAAEKKAAKKAKKAKPEPVVEAASETPKKKAPKVKVSDAAAREHEANAEPDAERHPHLAHLDRVKELTEIIGDPETKKKARAAAEAELAELRAEGERINAEKLAAEDAALKARVTKKRAEREAAGGKDEPTPDMQKLKSKRAAAKAEREEAKATAVEEVATEEGRVFAAGESVAAEGEAPAFAKPSDADPVLESGRNGYKIIQLDADGKPDPRKVRQMTRITTYVGNIDDETSLKKWEKRLLAEGLSADASSPESVELFSKVNDLVHRRDVAVAKAVKADRKGKLGVGELGAVIKRAEKEAKDALDAIVEEALLIAGRNDKANFGSHLHTLAEISDEKGIDAVRTLHESGELVAHDNDNINEGLEPMPVTATDLASIEAYAARMQRLGAKVVYSEAVVVNDDLGNAGRLDRIITAKLPELVVGRGTPEEYTRPADTRARRYVADIKSGSLEFGAGKIARQLAAYAVADIYDLETGERTPHRAARDVALVFHLPLGEGTCSVYAVDLKAGIRMLKLSGEVRRARTTGKKAIDLSVDIADPSTETEAE